MPVQRFVVVGASLAGLRAVEAARKAAFAGSITLIGAEPHLPYDRPPLSKAFLAPTDDGQDPATPTFRTDAVFADELDVELRLGRPATGLDTVRKVVAIDDDEVPYDALVIATGSRLRTIPGTEDLDGVTGLRTIDDARRVRAALEAGARVVVVGAGFIGSEVAAGATTRGLDATIVEALPTPLVRATGTAMGGAIARLHERHDTTLLTGVGVASIEGDGRVERVVLDDGRVLPADLVVVGVGIEPETRWLEGSGLTLDDGVLADETLWTGADGVYAAGDVVRWPNVTTGATQRLENWTTAAEQGAAAARNALDPDAATPYATVPYFWSDWYDARIQFLGSADADEVVVVDGDPDVDDRWIALYRRGDRLVGALSLNGRTEIMKYRRLLLNGAPWSDALEHAAERARLAALKRAAQQAE